MKRISLILLLVLSCLALNAQNGRPSQTTAMYMT